MTIIFGGLSLPRPTAMNMPMPISVALSASMTSIHRPCFSAIARASSARTAGLTSFEARLESVRAMFAPSAMTMPRSAAVVRAAASAPGAMRISSSRIGGDRVDLVAIDRPRVVGALDDASGDQPGRDRGVSVEAIGERRDPDREALDRSTAEPPFRRGRDPPDGLAVERRSVAETDRQDPSARGLATGRQRGRIALARELPERDERLELTAGPPVELAERAVEGRLGGDGHDEDIRGHVPRLIGDDTKLHAVGLRKAQPRDAGSGAR